MGEDSEPVRRRSPSHGSGQLTNQAVPPDEHPWIEEFGATASYRALRQGIRSYYRTYLPLTAEARGLDALNPGNGWVSRLCHDPRVAVAVLHEMTIPHQLGGRLFILHPHRPIAAWTHNDRLTGVIIRGLQSGRDCLIEAPFFIDATPHGELLELARVEHVIGAESQAETDEPHAPERADPRDQQAITVCFAMEHRQGEDHTIDKPRQYELWRDHRPPGWPGSVLSWTTVNPETHEPLTRYLFEAQDGRPWWHFRRILDRKCFVDGFAASDITVVNWPQNDYWFGPVCGVDQGRNLEAARQLSLSLLYWLQTEVPRPDGGLGYPGLRLRGDVMGGTPDGLAPPGSVGIGQLLGRIDRSWDMREEIRARINQRLPALQQRARQTNDLLTSYLEERAPTAVFEANRPQPEQGGDSA